MDLPGAGVEVGDERIPRVDGSTVLDVFRHGVTACPLSCY